MNMHKHTNKSLKQKQDHIPAQTDANKNAHPCQQTISSMRQKGCALFAPLKTSQNHPNFD